MFFSSRFNSLSLLLFVVKNIGSYPNPFFDNNQYLEQ
ncbi:hypothetical protein BDCR2A_00288 [Borrelia duttonii CR2A]|uniref:Uncharacterized protein n=1 Tax=Borrelia duttonii CR2A TaxID=1432657 RepID=W6TI78_9SPIR|nr:hypothetical protein BDCR2A_00288 [Borrelia duttonii CR2A]